MRLVVGHGVGQVGAGVAHEDGEEGERYEYRIQNVVGADRQPLVLGLKRVTVRLVHDHRHLRLSDGSARPFHLQFLVHHIGSEIPCARMNRKWMYIRSTMRAGSRNTCMSK